MQNEEYETFEVELDTDLYDALSNKAKNCNMSLEEYCTKILTDVVKSDEVETIAQKSYPIGQE